MKKKIKNQYKKSKQNENIQTFSKSEMGVGEESRESIQAGEKLIVLGMHWEIYLQMVWQKK